MIQRAVLPIIMRNVHFLVSKLTAKGMDARILSMRNGVGKQMGVKFQGKLS